jgi:hypothetical protein
MIRVKNSIEYKNLICLFQFGHASQITTGINLNSFSVHLIDLIKQK